MKRPKFKRVAVVPALFSLSLDARAWVADRLSGLFGRREQAA